MPHPPTYECFDLSDVDYLLSLLESVILASSITSFKIAGKTATL